MLRVAFKSTAHITTSQKQLGEREMALLIFGSLAGAAMLVAYALEARSHWFVLALALASAVAAVYGYLIEAWPFVVIEAAWSLVALRRWWLRWASTQRV